MRRLSSSLRDRPAEDTVRLARRLMPALGISRVTDITRMDRLGLPVFASIRPRSRVIRVHAGKGLSPAEAEAGALMEAIEHYAAEPSSERRGRRRTIAAIASQFDGRFQFVDFAPSIGARPRAGQRMTTTPCDDVIAGRGFDVPSELIHFPFEARGEPSLFGASTNGLASGNTLDEATLHGILEVLERDATSMDRVKRAWSWIDRATLPEPFVAMSSRWRSVGVELGVRVIPNAFGYACFEARLYESGSDTVEMSAGSGLHPDREIALARAICEAAQSRLNFIHGGRDDITFFYERHASWSAEERARAEATLAAAFFDPRDAMAFGAVPTCAVGDSSGHALQSVLDVLAARGFGCVLRHRFDLDLMGLHVVKVVVPRCENFDVHRRRMGPRLLARTLGDE